VDALEETLYRSAPRAVLDDPDVRRELAALTESRARVAGRPGGRFALPVLLGSGVLLLGGTGAVAATQFGPWTVVADPDYVVARDWYDLDGTYLGSCEAHVRIEHPAPEVLAAAQRSLASLDLDELGPDPTSVALWLASFDRLDDYSHLIPGEPTDPTIADLTPIDTSPEVRAFASDARILQIALIQTVHDAVSADLEAAGLDPDVAFTGEGEIQCSTDPGPWPVQG